MNRRRIGTIVRSVHNRRHNGAIIVWFVLINFVPQTLHSSVSVRVVYYSSVSVLVDFIPHSLHKCLKIKLIECSVLIIIIDSI